MAERRISFVGRGFTCKMNGVADKDKGVQRGVQRMRAGFTPSGRQGPATSLKEGGKWGEDGLDGEMRAL